MKHYRLQSNPLFQSISGNIDRENLIIRDLVAMEANQEALGHGMMTDLKSLYMVEALANANPKGLRSRFGHPGMSENATGKQIGVTRNYRVKDNRLLNDLYFTPAARKSPVFNNDPIEYLFDIAENSPGEMGQSMVLYTDVVWIMADGSEQSALDDFGWFDPDERPDGAMTELPIMRPMIVEYNDIVNEGALTPAGLFTKLSVSGYSEELFVLLDEWRQQFKIPLADVPRKAHEVLGKYLRMRGYTKKELTMPVTKKTTKKAVLEELDDLILDGLESLEEEALEESEDSANEETNDSDSTLDDTIAVAEATADELREAPEPSMERKLAVLQARLDKAERALQLSAANIQLLLKRIQRLESEPVVTEVIGSVPAPSKAALKKEPISVQQRLQTKTPGKPSSPVAARLARNIQRKKDYGLED